VQKNLQSMEVLHRVRNLDVFTSLPQSLCMLLGRPDWLVWLGDKEHLKEMAAHLD
jgi:hypothetical protein